jgi:Zn-dependent alcohol dehydrogenase
METTKAAVLRGPEFLEIETLELEAPGPREVLVDVRATGVCRSDYDRYEGRDDVAYPIVLGHEGAGVIEAVGSDVSTVEAGDHVVLSVVPSCGVCPDCERGRPYLCGPGLEAAFSGTMLDGTRRLSADGEPVDHFFAQSSYATKAVVPERSAVPVRTDVPFETAALLGCGATTGIGGVFSVAGVGPGESVAVFGCGGVGSSAILAADAVGVSPLVAVDVDDSKLDRAAAFGATHCVDATAAPAERIHELVGGVEYALEFAGSVPAMRAAVESTRPGGTAVVSGSVPAGEELPLQARTLMQGRTVRGNVAGALRPTVDIPRYADMYADGRLDLDSLLTETFPLDRLEAAFEAMENGEVVRGAITFE